jgi:hypothetical protein
MAEGPGRAIQGPGVTEALICRRILIEYPFSSRYFRSALNASSRLLRMLSWRSEEMIFAPVRSVT